MAPIRRRKIGLATTALVAIFLIGCGLGHPGSARAETPARFYSHLPPEDYSDPIWVAATELLSGGGKLNWQVLDEVDARAWLPDLARRLGQVGIQDIAEEDCSIWRSRNQSSPVQAPNDGLLDLLKGARAVFEGTIIERTPGFLFGIPATLLTVKVTESFWMDMEVKPSAGQLYLAYPQASFSADGWIICGGWQEGPPAPPTGSKVVVLAQSPPNDRGGALLQVSLEEMVFVADDDSLTWPANLARDPAMEGILAARDLADRIRLEIGRLQPLKYSSEPSVENGKPQ